MVALSKLLVPVIYEIVSRTRWPYLTMRSHQFVFFILEDVLWFSSFNMHYSGQKTFGSEDIDILDVFGVFSKKDEVG
jgi:hypothetical protein